MKSIVRVLSILVIALMITPFPFVTYGQGMVSYATTLTDSGRTKVIVAGSAEELARRSPAAPNDAFFSVDVSQKRTAGSLATDEISDEVKDIITDGGSIADKKGAVAETLEDSGFYYAEEGAGREVEVTSIFASQRLRLVAEKKESIDAHGAVKAVYYKGYYLLSYGSEAEAKEAYEVLCSEYGKDYVLKDMPIRANENGWGTPRMGMSTQKKKAFPEGSEVIVAVCDSGIYGEHEIFSGTQLLDGYNVLATPESEYARDPQCIRYNDPRDANDDYGHGTGVAGIIAESTPSNVKIMPIKVLDAKGEGFSEDMMTGVAYAEEHGADIVNLSLGSSDEEIGNVNAYGEILSGYSALLICAAGNDGANMDAPRMTEFPAELDCTVCVGAFTTDDSICRFSNRGEAVDYAAPGDKLKVASNSGKSAYVSNSLGTSFSCPYVSAAAALIKAEHPELDKDGLIAGLDSISVDMGEEGRDVKFGKGCPVFGENELKLGGDIGEIEGLIVELPGSSDLEYTGTPYEPVPVISYYFKKLIKNKDFTLDYSGNVNAGQASVTVSGIGDYSGSMVMPFTIKPADLSGNMDLTRESFTYNGSEIRPMVEGSYLGMDLKKGTDFEVSYPGEGIYPGSYHVLVTGKGNYSGSADLTFNIRKAANGMRVRPVTYTVSRSKLKKKARVIPVKKVIRVSGADGKVGYSRVSGSKYLKLSRSTGKITIKKKTPKGTYKMRIKVTARGDKAHGEKTESVTIKVRVK